MLEQHALQLVKHVSHKSKPCGFLLPKGKEDTVDIHNDSALLASAVPAVPARPPKTCRNEAKSMPEQERNYGPTNKTQKTIKETYSNGP